MTRIENAVVVEAPPAAVWDVITEPSNVPALYPDAISVSVDPPGRSAVGQEVTIVGKAGRRKLLILARIAEVVPGERIVTENRPGGLFRSFSQSILLKPEGAATAVTLVYEYEVSAGYIGKLLNDILIERLVRDNISGYVKNLKSFAELRPIDG